VDELKERHLYPGFHLLQRCQVNLPLMLQGKTYHTSAKIKLLRINKTVHKPERDGYLYLVELISQSNPVFLF
jgi:hypothetical protein